jgi:phosphoribosyl-ATP pyrophosphohydrolase/phosphoribosyl-AMP cyclohydrolase
MSPEEIEGLDWRKQAGLLPAIVQDAGNFRVLMLGYMDRAAVEATVATGRVVFYSRRRNALWTKGETSGHFLDLVSISADCDRDALLVLARPRGTTCHLGSASCFAGAPADFLAELDGVAAERDARRSPGSYTSALFEQGTRHIAQKVGEEAVETALAALVQDDRSLLGEAADLLFHLAVLLRSRGMAMRDAVAVLESRHRG